MDIEKTREYYAGKTRENVCSCAYCKNLVDEIRQAYPEFAEYLSAFGVNIDIPFEVMLPLDPVDGYMDYWGVEYLICGNSCGFENTTVGDISVCVTDSHPDAKYKGEHFIILAGGFHIKCRYDKYSFD